ncbi:MAG TPA: D-2-hydroxyacid dehydrogenase [Methylomirabilota bacterium]|nr:D-2-hydroxyacid dehydrogenase [Methylomirabilota bacterium]
MHTTTVLVLGAVGDRPLERIAAVDPGVRVIDARGVFEVEYAGTWPTETVERYVPRSLIIQSTTTRAERDALLAEADVICIRFPFPLDLRARAPRLKWLHQTPAGASNLRMGDVWGSDVLATTSRGVNNSLPIAEYVLATMLLFAKSLPQAFHDRARRTFERRAYRSVLVQGKTIGIIGLGGIGSEVARLAKAVGMRVVATRRSVTTPERNTQGVDELLPPTELSSLLAQSDFVALCAQWTPATDKLIGAAQLRVMKPTAYLINIARGELIDQPALIKALREGWIAGAALDVYTDEFTGPPPEELWRLPNVVITPHTSVGTDVSHAKGMEVFCENLRRYLKGEPLLNVIDWQRGY